MNISTRIFHPNARSLCYICHKNKVLLGLKKEGFGKNLWNGPGGTQDPNESPLQTWFLLLPITRKCICTPSSPTTLPERRKKPMKCVPNGLTLAIFHFTPCGRMISIGCLTPWPENSSPAVFSLIRKINSSSTRLKFYDPIIQPV